MTQRYSHYNSNYSNNSHGHFSNEEEIEMGGKRRNWNDITIVRACKWGSGRSTRVVMF